MGKNNFTKIGFDYGVKPFYILLGDMEFSDLFKRLTVGVLPIFLGKAIAKKK